MRPRLKYGYCKCRFQWPTGTNSPDSKGDVLIVTAEAKGSDDETSTSLSGE